MFSKILIANRGEIACRIIRTARRMGIKTVAVYSDADAKALHVKLADQAVHIGPSPAAQSYLQMDRIIEAAVQSGAQAIHPGYGFLSENPEFADKILAAGLVFIGPDADAIRKMGLKDEAKRLMEEAGVPVVPGYHGADQDAAVLADEADKIGYPVLIKARAGGGGKGMRLVKQAKEFQSSLDSAQREGKASFGDGHVLIEKFIESPRHIEVQVFGDKHGNVVHLYERDCSMQRRHQKVIEEAPAPNMPDEVRKAMTDAAVTAAQQISYHGAGTIEFIVDASGPLRSDGFWFMEMNTRLQVEHPVTEAVTGQDLVEWQLRVADGEALPLVQKDIQLMGHAIEARIYAEDTAHDFRPAPGTVVALQFCKDVRVDTGVQSGDQVSPFYDPMIAKVISHSETRNGAIRDLATGLTDSFVAGTATNMGFLKRLITDADFTSIKLETGLIERKLPALTKIATPSAFDLLVGLVIEHSLDICDPRLGWQHWQAPKIKATLIGLDGPLDVCISWDADGSIELESDGCTGTFVDFTVKENKVSAREGTSNCVARFVRVDRKVYIKSVDDVHIFEVPDPLDVASVAAQDSDAILSPMTGSVTVVHKTAGQKISMGDPLVVVEAMKMEHVLTAMSDGVIKEVLCKTSDAVQEGAILMTLEDATT